MYDHDITGFEFLLNLYQFLTTYYIQTSQNMLIPRINTLKELLGKALCVNLI